MLSRKPLLLITAGLAMGLTLSACRKGRLEPLVVFLALDGATPDVIEDLRHENKLPALDKLIRSGTFGRLQSLSAKRIMKENLRNYYSSPILWTTIATGKIPEKHGIRDFVLPIAETSSVWMGSEDDPPRAELTLPELTGPSPHRLLLRMHSNRAEGEQSAQLLLNGEPLDTIRLSVEWTELSFQLPAEMLRPAKNRLELVFSRQSSPAEHGGSNDRRPLAAELSFLSVTDAQGREVFHLDPVYQRFSLGRGFYMPRANLTEVQSSHWRAMPVWTLLGQLGHPVGIIGYWGTWPAYEVSGFLVSSRMGIGVKRKGSERLTFPPELAEEIEPLAPLAEDLNPMFDRLHVSECEPRFIDQKSVLKKILVQDELYFRAAQKLLPTMDRGFFTVYFRAIDVASHVSLHWRHGAPLEEGCPESIRDVVDETYGQVDRWVGSLLENLPDHATVLAVSDHGMKPLDYAGGHDPYGIFIASGPGIRRGATFYGASVLDIAPTILYLFGGPIPLDMDGKLMVQILEAGTLKDHPPRYEDMDTSLSSDEKALTEGTDEILDQLRALGYIQ